MGATKWMLATTAVLTVVAPLDASSQTAPDATAWGDPVGGVQIRLVEMANAPQRPATDYMPRLGLQIRNLGGEAVAFLYDEVSAGAQFQIDGVWYGPGGYAGNLAATGNVAPGAESPVIALPFCNTVDRCNGLYPLEPDGRLILPLGSRLLLQPGRHVVRVRGYVRQPGGAADARNLIRNSSALQLTSNPINVEVPDFPGLASLMAQVPLGGPASSAAVHLIVEKYPEAAVDAIRAGLRAAANEFACVDLILRAEKLDTEEVTAFLRSKLGPDSGIPSRVAAAMILNERGHPEAVPAVIDAWRSIQPRFLKNEREPAHADCNNVPAGQRRFTGNEATAYNEAGMVIAFLAASGDVAAIEALGRGIERAPVDARLAVVRAFLPQGNGGGSWTGRAISLTGLPVGGSRKLPTDAASAAIERLLVAALDDTARRYDMRGSWNGITWEDPRIADMAALVLSTRWPAKYRFQWLADARQCDVQIAAMRDTWRRESGADMAPRQFAVDVPPEKWAVSAALEIIRVTVQDAGYVGPAIHAGLLDDLNKLQLAASEVAGYDGTDRAVARSRKDAFAAAFRSAMNRATAISNRNDEAAEAREKSRQLATRLRDVYDQYLP